MRLMAFIISIFIPLKLLAQSSPSPISPSVLDHVVTITEIIRHMPIEEINSVSNRRSLRQLMSANLPMQLDRNLAEVLAETYEVDREIANLLETIATSDCTLTEDELSSLDRTIESTRETSLTGRLVLMARINLGNEGYNRSFINAAIGPRTSSATIDFIRTYIPQSPAVPDEEFCNSIREGTDLTNADFQQNQGLSIIQDHSIPLENICNYFVRYIAASERGQAAYYAADPDFSLVSNYLAEQHRDGQMTEDEIIAETWYLISRHTESLENILGRVGSSLSFDGQTRLISSIMGKLQTRWENGRDTGSRAYTCEEMLINLRDNPNDSEMGVCRDMHLCGARMLVALNPAFRDHAFTVSFPTLGTYHTVLLAEDPNNPNSTRIINYSAMTASEGATGATLLSQQTSLPDTGGIFWVHDTNGNMLRTVESNRLSIIRELTANPNTRRTENTNITPSVAAASYTLTNGMNIGFSTANLSDGDTLVFAYLNGERQVQASVLRETENSTLSFDRTRGFAVGATYYRQDVQLTGLHQQTALQQNTANLYARLESHYDLVLTAGSEDEHRLRFRILGLEALVDGGYVRLHNEQPGVLDPTEQGAMGSGSLISSTGVDYRYRTPNVEVNLDAEVQADHVTVDVSMSDGWGVPVLQTATVDGSIATRHQLDASNIISASLALGLMHSNVGSYSEADARLCLDRDNIGLCVRGQARVPLADCTSIVSGGCNLLLRESAEVNIRRPSGSTVSVGAEAYQTRGMHNAEGRHRGAQLFLSVTPSPP